MHIPRILLLFVALLLWAGNHAYGSDDNAGGAVTLDEVTVSATRIKLYFEGDTVVYNADVLMAAEGAMLGDLILKMEGIEIDRHGQILYHGRKIESLLLDGRRLFDGNHQVLMDNLGAYAVDKIKVYERDDDHTELTGYSASGQSPMVIDVTLKRRYAMGKWVNVDAGYGTSDRYLGRAFALGFTKELSVSAYVNANNLSYGENPRRGDSWSAGRARLNESDYLSGGLSYEWKKSDGRRRVSGSLGVYSGHEVNRTSMSSLTYLPDGGVDSRVRYGVERTGVLRLFTEHQLYMNFGGADLKLAPAVNYWRNRSRGSVTAATFDEELQRRISALEIEELYDAVGSDADSLLRHVVNRQISRSKSEIDRLEGSLKGTSTVKLREAGAVKHNLQFSAEGSYSRSHGGLYSASLINYGANPEAADDFYAYTRRQPAYAVGAGASARYEMNIARRHTVSVSYGYSYEHGRDTYDRYMLSDLSGVSAESLKFGMRPAVSELGGVIDPANSHHSLLTTHAHEVGVKAYMQLGGGVNLLVNPSVRLLSRRYAYERVSADTVARDRAVLPALRASLGYDGSRGGGHEYSARLSWSSQPVTFMMDNLIDVVDSTDPLHLTYGNPHLRHGYGHGALAEFTYRRSSGTPHTHRLSAGVNFRTDDVVRGTYYNPATGVYVTSVYNVDGTRGCEASYSGTGYVVRRSGWNLEYDAGVRAEYARSADMAGVGSAPVRNFVRHGKLRPEASLTVNFGARNHSVRVGWNGTLEHYSGDAADYVSFSSRVMSWRAAANFVLPLDFKLSTDWRLTRRSGYLDERLNRSECVWNVTASWLWRKANVTFIADGYDLLGQLRNVRYSANALGRTEIRRNTLPAYVMLRVRYHIDVSPAR